MSESPKRRRLPFSLVAIPFTLVWACIMVAIVVFGAGTPYGREALFGGLMGMISTGWWLAHCTGGLSRRMDSQTGLPHDPRP
jgi:hypothetical protein